MAKKIKTEEVAAPEVLRSVTEIVEAEEARQAQEKADALKAQKAKYRELVTKGELTADEAKVFLTLLKPLGKTAQDVTADKNILDQIRRQESMATKETLEELNRAYVEARSEFNNLSDHARKHDPAMLGSVTVKAAKAKMELAYGRINRFHDEHYAINKLKAQAPDLFS